MKINKLKIYSKQVGQVLLILSLKCPFCNEFFSNWETINEHIRVKHRDKVKLVRLGHPEAKGKRYPST